MIWTFNRFMLGTDCLLASASVAIIVTKKKIYRHLKKIYAANRVMGSDHAGPNVTLNYSCNFEL